MIGDFLRIPKKRVGALVGAGGKTKKMLSEKFGCAIEVSRDGEVLLSGEDPLSVFKLKSAIKAIGRGFSAGHVLKLLKDEYVLDIISIKKEVGESEKAIVRAKSRVIGAHGSSKQRIEDLTGTKIAVYGKTVSILGKYDDVYDAREAILMLMSGATHKSTYTSIIRRRTLRQKE